MLNIVLTKPFQKGYKLAKKRHLDISKLESVIDKLAKQEKLEAKYHDHELKGEYAGCRECHIEPDWLLIYQINNNKLELILLYTGTHSDLF